MKKRTIAMIVSLVLALALGLGGTLAYLTDTDADINTMVLGNVQIVQNEQRRVEKDGVFTNVLEAYQNDKTLVPYTDREENTPDTVTIGEYQVTINDRYNNYIDKIVTVTNTGNSDAYVRTLVALPTGGTEHWRQYDAAADVWLHWNLCKDVYTHWDLEEVTGPGKFFIEVGGVEYEVWQFTHKEPLAPGAITYPSLTGVFMDKRVDMNENGYFMTVGTETYPIKNIADAEGKLNVLVLSQAVQAAGFADAETALNEAFPVTSANLNAWFNKLEVGSPGEKNEDNNPPEYVTPAVASTADEMIEALENGEDVVLTNPIVIDPANMSNAYGTTGINIKNGQTIDGNGNTIDISGADGTWDSGINTTGGLIKDVTVTGSFRGIFINHNSTHSERVILENVTIDGTTYTISCDQGLNQGLTATDCTFNGWTSYAATLGDAEFINCTFSEGSGYAYCRPYAPTAFVGCEFEAGFQMDARAAVTFENCTLDGVALTDANIATLVTSNIANVTSVK